MGNPSTTKQILSKIDGTPSGFVQIVNGKLLDRKALDGLLAEGERTAQKN